MVKLIVTTTVKLLLAGLVGVALHAQTDADRERRLAELERKMRQLDPAFSPAAGSIDIRLADLERRVEALLAAGNPVPAAPAAAPEQSPLQPVSITGDYQKSGEGETRLPVAGYME